MDTVRALRGDGPWFVSIELHTLPWSPDDLVSSGQAPVAPSAYMLRSAIDHGCRTAVLSFAPSEYLAGFEPLVHRWMTVDTRSVRACLAAIEELDGPIAAVTSSIDNFVGIASRVAAHLGLRGTNPRGAAMARDESAVRRALSESGTPNARWAAADIDAALTTSPIGYPCVVKPVDGAGGWDVKLVQDDHELEELCAAHLGREYGRQVRPRRRLVFEEHLAGALVSCEGFVDNGRVEIFGYSDRVLGPLPSFVEVAVRFSPAVLDERLGDYTEECLRSVSYTFGAFHLEMIVSPDRLTLVELNARLIGGGLQHAMSAVSSAPASDYCVGRLLGVSAQPPTFSGGATQLQLFAETSGVLNAVSGIQEAGAVPGCIAVGALPGPGHRVIGPPESNSDALGFVHATGQGREDSWETALAAAARLDFDMSPCEPPRGSDADSVQRGVPSGGPSVARTCRQPSPGWL